MRRRPRSGGSLDWGSVERLKKLKCLASSACYARTLSGVRIAWYPMSDRSGSNCVGFDTIDYRPPQLKLDLSGAKKMHFCTCPLDQSCENFPCPVFPFKM